MRIGRLLGLTAALAACGDLVAATPDEGGAAPSTDAGGPNQDASPRPDDGATPFDGNLPLGDGSVPLRAPAPTQRATPPITATCKVMVDDHLDTLDLDLGTLTRGPHVYFNEPGNVRTLGLRGTEVFACDQVVVKVLDGGGISSSDVACDTVLADDVAIVVIRDGLIEQYSDFQHVVEHVPFATAPYGPVTWPRSALFYDQVLWLTADQRRLEKATIDGTLPVGTVALAREGYPAITGVASVPDGRILVAAGKGIAVYDAFTGEHLQGRLLEGNLGPYGAMACQASAPVLGSCTGQADATYCSTTYSDAAYTCSGGSIASELRCPAGQVCQRDEDGHALFQDGALDCRTRVRTQDGCEGLPDGTWCSVQGQPYAYPCVNGQFAGSPLFCPGQTGTCQSGPDGKALVNAEGMPICAQDGG